MSYENTINRKELGCEMCGKPTEEYQQDEYATWCSAACKDAWEEKIKVREARKKTPPQVKFFDTVKKEFPKNQDIYFVDRYGKVMSFTGPNDLFFEENIIPVPFTGRFDNNKTPLYEEDIIKTFSGYANDFIVGKFFKENGHYFIHCLQYGNDSRLHESLFDHDNFEIIGSSLTNPGMLNEAI